MRCTLEHSVSSIILETNILCVCVYYAYVSLQSYDSNIPAGKSVIMFEEIESYRERNRARERERGGGITER